MELLSFLGEPAVRWSLIVLGQHGKTPNGALWKFLRVADANLIGNALEQLVESASHTLPSIERL